MRSFI
jgi:hypothetical protein